MNALIKRSIHTRHRISGSPQLLVTLFRALWPVFLVYAQSAPSETDTASPGLSQKLETPKIVEADFIDLSKIDSFTKFRSGEGHDFSDAFESCRSMKHYFKLAPAADWAHVTIFSPVKGAVIRTTEEWAGTKVEIQSDEWPECTVAIFHVRLLKPLRLKERVTAGQALGFHYGKQTYSDISISIDTPRGRKFISYFDVMSDSVFKQYQRRGLDSRDDAVISKQLRDSDPLICEKGKFLTPGHIPNWVNLDQEPGH